jgi:hypothetical protein
MKSPKLSHFLIIPVFLVSLPAHADFGNWFVANKRISNVLNTPAKKISYRFTCQENMSLSAAAVFCMESVHSPAYLVSLQEDEGGNPSGTILTSYNFIPQARSWATIPLSIVPLIKGKVYHLVLEPDMLRGGGHPVAVIGSSNYASFLTTDVLNQMHPNDGSPDPKANSLFFEDGKWRELNQEPVYAIFGLGFKSQGNPYDDPGIRPIYGNLLQGQTLHFHCGYTAKALAFKVKKQGNPTAPLKFSVLVNDYHAHKCTPIYTSVALDPGKTPTDFQWVTIGMPPQIASLFRAECWFFVFQSDSGRKSKNTPGCEDCYLMTDLGNSGGLANAADLTFDGGPHLSRAVYSVDGGNPFHWIDEFERDANVGVIGPSCPPSYPREFNPIPIPIPLEDEPRFEP